MDDVDPDVVEAMFNTNKEFFLGALCGATKVSLIRDGFLKWAQLQQLDLDEAFDDIKFRLRFVQIHPFCDRSYKTYNKKWASDDEYINVSYKDVFHEEVYDDQSRIYSVPLNELGLEIQYTKQENCSLGHTHFTSRYHLFSAPQWLAMINHWNLGMRGKTFVKEYLTDFFYDV